MAPRIVVVGCGVAGTAAAWSAARTGASVTVVGDFDGASRFMSGALDFQSWEEDDSRREVAGDARAFCDAIGLWLIGDRAACVATPWGIVRPARGHDRAVLDLAASGVRRVAVVRADRPDWDADLLAAAWRDDPWCVSRAMRFEPVSVDIVDGDRERWMPDAELAALLDDDVRCRDVARRLRDGTRGFDAVLTGPWLGIDTDAAAVISREASRPVGEALSLPASSAGLRFTRARDRLLSAVGVTASRGTVAEVIASGRGVIVRLQAEADAIECDAVVLATGGLAGGGILYDPSEMDVAPEMPAAPRDPFASSVRSDAVLAFEGRPVSIVGSMFGLDLARLTWPSSAHASWALDTLCYVTRDHACVDRDGRVLQGVWAAGQVASPRALGVLGAVESGVLAGRSAAAASAGPVMDRCDWTS
jgi:glycerol-3-phosphate dehydrogenase subunit B